MKPEAEAQAIVVRYCEFKRIPIFHIPNGGSRNPAEAANLKQQGVKAGVPDLMVPIAKRGCHGLFIEMKVGGNKTTEKQEEWIKLLSDQGYAVDVCYGAQAAIDLIDWYLRG